MIASRFGTIARRFGTTAVKNGGHGGVPGENLPFKIGGPYRNAVLIVLFFSVPFAAPFLIVRHQMLKA